MGPFLYTFIEVIPIVTLSKIKDIYMEFLLHKECVYKDSFIQKSCLPHRKVTYKKLFLLNVEFTIEMLFIKILSQKKDSSFEELFFKEFYGKDDCKVFIQKLYLWRSFFLLSSVQVFFRVTLSIRESPWKHSSDISFGKGPHRESSKERIVTENLSLSVHKDIV